MSGDSDTGRAALRAAMRALRQRARKALATARTSPRRATVDARTNIVVATHTGEDGANTSATARQSASIRQGGAPEEEDVR